MMKRAFPLLLLRIGAVIVGLSMLAFAILTIVKLLVSVLVIAGIGAGLFKLIQHKRASCFLPYQKSGVFPYGKEDSPLSVQPIFARGKHKNQTIIPIH